MRIGVLGPLEVSAGDRAVPVPGRRLRVLLLRLAGDPGRWISADALAGAVWGEEQPADPANSLQSLVSRLRRTLGDADAVESSPAGYRLSLVPDDVDAGRFHRLVAEGRALARAGDVRADAVLTEALALWRGTPFADDDSPEAAARRAALADLRLDAVLERSRLALATGRGSSTVPDLERLVAEHPVREDLALALLDALTAAGRPADALSAYERIRCALAEELGADPSAELRERHAALLRAEPAVRRPQGNLPARMTSFVGREDDVRGLTERLAAGRLVTVVGAGGSGKTRLATEVAAAALDGGADGPSVPEGVWLVELAPVTDPSGVASAVLDAVGPREVTLPDPTRVRSDVRDRLLDRLAPARSLLVLDNCEHLVDAAAALVTELLGRCPGVRILATSREPLGVDGESLYPLGPLPVPGADDDAIADSPAVRLLMDRARAASADLAVDDDVVEIVRRLDGLPLAIELAAARLRSLSPAEVAERLADRFQLLTGGRRTATPRHRTLAAVVEWSWDLLTPLEREVAEHLSVFPSGAREPALGTVCPAFAAGAPRSELTDVLQALVDKSVVLAVRTPAGTRYRMLETLREYGAGRLAEYGAGVVARAAHARYIATLVADCDPLLRGPQQLGALQVLDDEHDEIQVALRTLVDEPDAAGALHMVTSLGWYWTLRDDSREAVHWLDAALAVPGARELPAAQLAEALAVLLGGAGPGMPTGAAERPAVSKLARQLLDAGDEHSVAVLLPPLLMMMAEENDAAEQLIAAATRHRDPWTRATARLMSLAFAENAGRLSSVRDSIDEGLAEWEALGDRWGTGTVLALRGQLRTVDGDQRGAAEDFERAHAYVRELGGSSDQVFVTMRLADLRLRAGDVDGARQHLASMRAQRSSGVAELLRQLLVLTLEAAIALATDDSATARAVYRDLADLLRWIDQEAPMGVHIGGLGHAAAASLAVRSGDLELAAGHAAQAYEHAVAANDRPILAEVGLAVAEWTAASGRPRDAAVVIGAAARLRGAEDRGHLGVVRLTTELCAILGETGFQAALAEGLALDAHQATEVLAPGGGDSSG